MDNPNPPSADELRALIGAASLAPSSHNTQPWLFRSNGQVIDLLADRTRALPANDPGDRELTISCGCALLNLRVAAAALGWLAEVDLLPDPAEEDLLARVRLVRGAQAHPDGALRPAIAQRRTYRQRFADTAPAPEAMLALAAAARAEGAMLSTLDSSDQRAYAGALVVEGDALQWANPHWRRELAAWMHPRRAGDGLTLPGLSIPVAQLVVRTFDLGGGVAARDRQVADASPVLAILVTERDEPRDWLGAGQALQRLLLTGVQLGLQASYLNQPVQLAALRTRLQHVAGCQGYPQLLLRIGTPLRTVQAAPRRPLSAIMTSR